jgi:hypothetical protein
MDSRQSYSGNRQDEIGKLLREGKDERQVMDDLRDKYNDKDLVNKIFSEYEEKMERIKRKASKFAQLILTKYSHYGTKKIMEKARKLKKKYNFSDDEFAAFTRIALSGNNPLLKVNIPTSAVAKTLGFELQGTGSKLRYEAADMPHVQDILKMHQENIPNHRAAILQSLTYKDCATEAITGRYDPTKMDKFSHIHPVLFALYVPRINLIDQHTLIGSISSVIESKYHNRQIKTQPDYELYYDMATDPNEVACTGLKAEKAVEDLKHRVKVQTELWKAVKNLRQGVYFSPDAKNFDMALAQCRNGIYDSPDYAYVNDEGTVIRKLMAVFSLRPTIVSVMPYGGAISSFNYDISRHASVQVTSIPIVNLKLPHNLRNVTLTVNLDDALTQPDTYIENKMIVLKMKNIIYSRDMIVFYVNRRLQSINFARMVAPYNFQALPSTVQSTEALNNVYVEVPFNMQISEENFLLRSTVMLETTPNLYGKDNVREIIVGSTAAIVIPRNIELGITQETHLQYDPLSASHLGRLPTNDFKPIQPVRDITSGYGGEILEEMMGKRGTIFVYVKTPPAF